METTNILSAQALENRNADIRNGKIKKEWLEDDQVLSFINALHELTK